MNWVKHPKYNIFVSDEGLVKGPSGNIRKPRKDRYGYLRINIHDENKKHKTVTIHRLVAECFLPFSTGMTVDHIDGNKENNNVTNLQCISQELNCSLDFTRGFRTALCTSVVIDGVEYYSKREAERKTGIARKNL